MSVSRCLGLIMLLFFASIEGVLLTIVSSSDFINRNNAEQLHLTMLGEYKGISKVNISKRSSMHFRNFSNYFQGQYMSSCKGCGLTNSKRKNFLIIKGGLVDPPFKYPWMVRLVISSKVKRGNKMYKMDSYCGGTIISEYFILTAAHCVKFPDLEINGNSQPYKKPENVIVHFLTNTYPLSKGPKAQKIILHPEYNIRTRKNDIALIKLKERINCDMYKYPICLPPSSLNIPNGMVLTATGWGKTESEALSKQLKELSINKVAFEKCYIYANARDVKGNTYCLEAPVGSPCVGDSGGPAFYAKDGKYYIIGVTSGGNEDCKEGKPFFYTAVPKFVNWIKQVTQS